MIRYDTDSCCCYYVIFRQRQSNANPSLLFPIHSWARQSCIYIIIYIIIIIYIYIYSYNLCISSTMQAFVGGWFSDA